MSKKKIPKKNHCSRREHAVQRWAASAHAGAVDRVVVHQRRGVKQLDTRRSGYKVVSIIAVGASGEEQDEWPKSFSTRTHEIKNEISDNRISRSGPPSRAALLLAEVLVA